MHTDNPKPNQATLEAMKPIVGKMARLILKSVKDAVPKSGWTKAHFYSRGRFSKLRIEMADKSVNSAINTPTSSTFFDLLDELRKINAGLTDKWYAFKITVTPDRKFDVLFDYNENDPTFFQN